MSPLLKVENLSVAYRRDGETVDALTDVTFDLAQGERLAVIGESGSGKSTLALALGRLLPPGTEVAGNIDWPGFAGDPRNGRAIGFVFQDPSGSLDPLQRAGDQIAEVAASNLGIDRTEARSRAQQLIERVRLPASAYRAWPHQLSGGQRQRISIACALAGKPKLLICDETTSALDTIVQAEVAKLILSLVEEEGMTLIFITHDIALASQIGDRIAVFHLGRMVQLGNARQVIRNPSDAYTSRLVASHISLEAPAIAVNLPASYRPAGVAP